MSSTIARCDHHWEIWFIIALSDGGVSTEPYPQRAIDCSENRLKLAGGTCHLLLFWGSTRTVFLENFFYRAERVGVGRLPGLSKGRPSAH